MTFLGDIFGYILNVIVYCLYSITWIIIHFLQNIMSSKQLSYKISCQVLKIAWRQKFFLIDVVSPRDFIAFHGEYTDPSYILRPNVSLYCLTADFAYFLETPERIVIYSSDVSAFQYIGQFKHATRLIKLPLSTFCRLTKAVGDPSVKVCFMPNTGRCGSTLLAKALGNVPGTLLHAEPDCLTNLGHLWKTKSVTQSEYEDLLVATVRILCKPATNVERTVIKTRSCASCHIYAISKHFPDITIIFGYRNSLKTISSFLGLMLSETAMSLALYLIDNDTFSKIVPWFRRRMFYYFCYMLDDPDNADNADRMNAVEQFAYALANCLTLMKTFKQQGGVFRPILYEDLIADETGMLKNVFQSLEIKEEYLSYALKAFADDSQAGSPLRRENIQNLERRRLTQENIIKANDIFSKFSLPDIRQQFTFSE